VVYRLAYNDDVVAFKMGRRGKRIGGSAFGRMGVWAFAKSHRLRGYLLVNIPCRKAVLFPQTPLRRYADTPTRDSSLACLPHFA
jgi:hypothetical protein